MMVQALNLHTWEAKIGKSLFPDQLGPYCKFQASQRYLMRPCLKTNKRMVPACRWCVCMCAPLHSRDSPGHCKGRGARSFAMVFGSGLVSSLWVRLAVQANV